MTREDIIRMAREQGLPETEVEGVFMVNTDDLGRFAAAEREACAKVCESWGLMEGANMCAAAIRARSTNMCQNSTELVETPQKLHRAGSFGE